MRRLHRAERYHDAGIPQVPDEGIESDPGGVIDEEEPEEEGVL